jgi:hypothetical protein
LISMRGFSPKKRAPLYRMTWTSFLAHTRLSTTNKHIDCLASFLKFLPCF